MHRKREIINEYLYGGLSILNNQHMASGFNLILKSDFRDFKEEYNKPKTIF
jgi:hypothetical protein